MTAIPAAAVCCLDKTGTPMASMHATMPCCADQCTLSSPNTGRDHDATLTAAPAPPTATTVGALITPKPATRVTMPIPVIEHVGDAYAAPPPFLINSQFRI